MIGMNDEYDVINTIVNATVANVRGTYQLEHFIIKTADQDGHLVMSMTDSRIGFRVHATRELSSLNDEPAFKIRSSLFNMANTVHERYEERMKENALATQSEAVG